MVILLIYFRAIIIPMTRKEYEKTEAFRRSVLKSRMKHKLKYCSQTQEWRVKNKSRISAYNKAYSENHKAEIADKRKKWRVANIDLIREYRRSYRIKNLDRIQNKALEFRNSDRGRSIRSYHQRIRNTRKVDAPSVYYTFKQLMEHFAEFDNRCVYCGSTNRISADHFIPLCRGGSDSLDNIVPACLSCNCSKGKSDPYIWLPSHCANKGG